MRRGMQIDDFVYALSQGGVTVHDVEALDSGAVATVEFDRPVVNNNRSCYYGYYDYESGDVGGTTSSTTGFMEGPDASDTGEGTSGSDMGLGGSASK